MFILIIRNFSLSCQYLDFTNMPRIYSPKGIFISLFEFFSTGAEAKSESTVAREAAGAVPRAEVHPPNSRAEALTPSTSDGAGPQRGD